MTKLRLVAISDTHERHRYVSLPEGDVLIHAGDITKKGSLQAIEDFATWMKEAPHKHKIVIAGNHDFCFEDERSADAEKILNNEGIIYLCDSGVTIEGIYFWGSPWQPWFYDWAFNLPRGEEIAAKWSLIPDNTQVLITHGPAFEIADKTTEGLHVGCEELAARIAALNCLKAHIFGHIHESYGIQKIAGVVYANASVCNRQYQPLNQPLVIEI